MRTRSTRRLLASLALALGCRQPAASVARDAAPHDARPHCHCDAAAMPTTGPLAGASLYHLDAPWTSQRGEPFALASLRGRPVVLLMFYGTCRSVCPLLVTDLLRLDRALSPEARSQTQFVLVSFDPARDTPERLRALAAERGLDPARYTLLRGTDDGVRTLATVLGVQYRRVEGGEFAHSNLITVLDREGVVAMQTEGVAQPVEPMAARLSEMVR